MEQSTAKKPNLEPHPPPATMRHPPRIATSMMARVCGAHIKVRNTSSTPPRRLRFQRRIRAVIPTILPFSASTPPVRNLLCWLSMPKPVRQKKKKKKKRIAISTQEWNTALEAAAARNRAA